MMTKPKTNKLLTGYNFTKGSAGRIQYIVIHYVGAAGGAEANCRYYAGRYIGASAHYFVGFDGEIWQSVEDKDIAWHCGAKSYKHAACRNSNSIGIELCVRKKSTAGMNAEDRDWYFEDATVDAAVKLTKYLMEKYGIDADHVLRHYDVTGKICPNPYVYNHTGHTWDAFQAAVTEALWESGQKQDGGSVPIPAGVPYMVTTTCDVLNIRSGPGIGFRAAGSIREKAGKKKKYTIVEEANGFGRLKSGAGWISLSYVKKA